MPLLLKALALAGVVPFIVSAAPLAPNSTLISDGTPPVRFQGPGAAIVLMVNPGDIDAICGAAPSGYTKIACSGQRDGAWIIVMPNPCAFDDERYAHILCHEKAHTLLWPATHGD